MVRHIHLPTSIASIPLCLPFPVRGSCPPPHPSRLTHATRGPPDCSSRPPSGRRICCVFATWLSGAPSHLPEVNNKLNQFSEKSMPMLPTHPSESSQQPSSRPHTAVVAMPDDIILTKALSRSSTTVKIQPVLACAQPRPALAATPCSCASDSGRKTRDRVLGRRTKHVWAAACGLPFRQRLHSTHRRCRCCRHGHAVDGAGAS